MGAEIAALLAPFAKWGALVAGFLIALWMIRRWIRKGGETRTELKQIQELGNELEDAKQDLEEERKASRDRWDARLRRRLRGE